MLPLHGSARRPVLMANYYMLGGDGREYGPVPAAQLRQWAAEGRANVHTQVRPEHSPKWAPLGAVPELAAPAGPVTAPILITSIPTGNPSPPSGAGPIPVAAPIPAGRSPAAGAFAPKFPPLPGGTHIPVPPGRLTGAGPEDPAQQVRMLAGELARGAYWMNLFAVLLLLIAGLAAVASFGAGLPALFLPVWAAILVFLVARRAQAAAVHGRWQDLQDALRHQRRFYILMAVFYLVLGLALAGLLVYFFTLGYLTAPLEFE